MTKIEETKSIYDNRNTHNYYWGFTLSFDNLMSDSIVLNGFSDHEGGNECPLVFNEKSHRFDSNKDSKKEFDIHVLNANLLEFNFPKNNKKEMYRKVVDDATELRRILFEGKYKNLATNESVEFLRNGEVKGIKNHYYHEVFYDFTVDGTFDIMAIQKDDKLASREMFHFKIKGDTLKLYTVKQGNLQNDDDKDDADVIQDIWLTLIKQKK